MKRVFDEFSSGVSIHIPQQRSSVRFGDLLGPRVLPPALGACKIALRPHVSGDNEYGLLQSFLQRRATF